MFNTNQRPMIFESQIWHSQKLTVKPSVQWQHFQNKKKIRHFSDFDDSKFLIFSFSSHINQDPLNFPLFERWFPVSFQH